MSKEIINQIIVKRNIEEPTQFFNPSFYYEEIDPQHFPFLGEAVERVKEAVFKGEKVLVVFDTDLDGISSGLITYLSIDEYDTRDNLGALDWKINKGKRHGIRFFPLKEISKYDLIVACDSTSGEFERYEELGTTTDIILLDHHGVPERCPYEHVITVNTELDDSPNKQCCGAGLAWKFSQLLLGYEGDYADLAALGTVADMMDLSVIDNRIICEKGFNNLKNPALKYLLSGREFNSESVSFSIAPLVNACQRLEKNEVPIKFFLSTDRKDMLKYKKEMESAKEEQKERELYLAENAKKYENKHIVVAVIGSRDATLTGLVANRLLGDKDKPAVVLVGGEGRGSMRAPTGMNFKDLINETGLAFSQGHDEAAGIKVGKGSEQDFIKSITKKIEGSGFEHTPSEPDAVVDERDLTKVLTKEILHMNKISGNGFPPISIQIDGVQPYSVLYLGKDKRHSKIIGDYNGVEYIKWGDTNPVEMYQEGDSFSFLGTPSINRFRGKETIQFIAEEVRLVR